jgi:hypothetical protein
MVWRPRLANEDNIPALEALIPISVRTLQVRQTYVWRVEAMLANPVKP